MTFYSTSGTAASQKALRNYVYHDTQLSFIPARHECVKANGDLVVTDDAEALNDTAHTVSGQDPE